MEADHLGQLESVESTLTRSLVAWSAGSIAVGASVLAVGKHSGNDVLAGFGRQTMAWGAVDAAIAGVGAAVQSRRGEIGVAERAAKASSLHRLLVVNAIADVGYMALGAWLTVRNRPGARLNTGDGAAIMIQGGFLLALDASQAQRLRGRREVTEF